jgi:hypothetical protein
MTTKNRNGRLYFYRNRRDSEELAFIDTSDNGGKSKISALPKPEPQTAKTVNQFTKEFQSLLMAATEDEGKLPALKQYFKENPDLFQKISPMMVVINA